MWIFMRILQAHYACSSKPDTKSLQSNAAFNALKHTIGMIMQNDVNKLDTGLRVLNYILIIMYMIFVFNCCCSK